jgi:hypothetical protein
VVVPLIFRHGAAETAFIVAVAGWAVFELVMRVGAEHELFAAGRKRLVPGVW